MQAHADAFSALQARLSPAEFSADPADLYQASMDNMRFSRMPSLRIFPGDEDSVQAVMEIANEFRVPLLARGAGSATTGATTPAVDGWVLDFSRWTQIHIDPIARMAYVQPGATVAAIDREAAKHGLCYPVDPGSHEYATVGGTIATNAGGMRAAKYGVTRDFVLSLEGFLPTGEFVRWGAPLRKFATGFNLRDLWIGSEGCLGVLTGAVLKLIPRPQARALAVATFCSDEAALNAVARLLQSSCQLSACEFIDQQSMDATRLFWQQHAPDALDSLPAAIGQAMQLPQPPALLILEVDGLADTLEPQWNAAAASMQLHKDGWVFTAEPATMATLWKIRKACSQAMFQLGPRKLNEDVVVPFDAQIELLAFTRSLRDQTGIPTPTFGHAADGNFHVHLMFDDQLPDQVEAAASALHSLMEKVVELGGAISGEHGVGLAKSAFLHLQFSPAELKAMRAIKAALDPNHILNPDKLFVPTEPWSMPRESVRLPWDH